VNGCEEEKRAISKGKKADPSSQFLRKPFPSPPMPSPFAKSLSENGPSHSVDVDLTFAISAAQERRKCYQVKEIHSKDKGGRGAEKVRAGREKRKPTDKHSSQQQNDASLFLSKSLIFFSSQCNYLTINFKKREEIRKTLK
jgi:hypothetical protein